MTPVSLEQSGQFGANMAIFEIAYWEPKKYHSSYPFHKMAIFFCYDFCKFKTVFLAHVCESAIASDPFD